MNGEPTQALQVGRGKTSLVRQSPALRLGTLPPIYKDLLDRILVAQAIVEGMTLLTADATLARYPARCAPSETVPLDGPRAFEGA